MKKSIERRSCGTLNVGFIGAGKMGGAIVASLLKAKMVRPGDVFVCDASEARRKELAGSLRLKASDVAETTAKCDVVFLAVKPQDMGAMLESIPPVNLKGPLYISIAAGKKLQWLEERMPCARVVRVMPNLAVSVGLGMSGFCKGALAKAADVKLAAKLLRCTGKAVEVPESQMDAITALSGSGPAFISYALQAMIDGGVALGLDEEVATELGLQTMLGTATVLSGRGVGVAEFIKAVTSAKGTTAAGLEVLEKSALRGTMKRTLAAAARRSGELSRLP